VLFSANNRAHAKPGYGTANLVLLCLTLASLANVWGKIETTNAGASAREQHAFNPVTDSTPPIKLGEAPRPPTDDNPHALRLYLGYRVFLALVMMVVFFVVERGPLGAINPSLFAIGIQAYFAITIISLVVGLTRSNQTETQSIIAVLLDIVCVSVLMYASGGVQSGLGMMIAIAIALGAMSMKGQTSLLLAAVASLVVISEQLIAQLLQTFANTAYLQSGLLGVSYFALAALAHELASRAQRSEQLVSQREEDLANLAQLNDYVIQQMQAGIMVVDRHHVVQVMNEAAWVLLGMPNTMRHYPLEQTSPELSAQYDEWLDNPAYQDQTFRAVPGGRDLRAGFTPLGEHGEQGTLIVLEDTATLTAQAQQMKLASLGRLTAGIAHEIRNPLGAISHAAQLLDESPELTQSDRRMSNIIQQNSRRVNEVVQNILKLSRQDLPKPKPLILSPWLEQQAADICRTHRLALDQFQVFIDPPATTVYADAGQLRQVLEVLCDNAVGHFKRDIDELKIKVLAGITHESGGPFIEIHDNGEGIAQDHATQLFEPFFTTRNEGTGLGLYIARQLSEANHVRLEYQPLPGGGSSFRLSFPNPKRP